MVTTLIFPSSVPAARDLAIEAVERGERVVGASSLAADPHAADFPRWERLPSIYDAGFLDALRDLVRRAGISRILCPAAAVHAAMARLQAEGRLPVPLVGTMPIVREVRRTRRAMEEGRKARAFIAALSEGASALSLHEVAAVLRQAEGIYGESDAAKIVAMMAVFAGLPAGDVVEIGALCGRTAYVLAHMARRHRTGAVLVVDPWDTDHAVQHDSPDQLLDLVEAWPAGAAFESFLLSLLPVAGGVGFGYLAEPSARAHGRWLADRQVETAEFGVARYAGRIALLHIDGNHDLAAVAEDCALWVPHLVAGGWLVLDDYVWLHGDGPRRVGDALLAERADIARAFVCGKALFVQLGKRS